jgi:hypothetical protein
MVVGSLPLTLDELNGSLRPPDERPQTITSP